MSKYSFRINTENFFPLSTKTPKKSLGQNFLVDDGILDDIKDILSLNQNDHLLEIGAGYGALTKRLIKHVRNMDVIEIDKNLVEFLNSRYSLHSRLHNVDALGFKISTISKQKKSIRVIGNLPYNISTSLLFQFFDEIEIIKDMHFMVQKEVADRILATPGTRFYGRLSIISQFYCEVEKLMTVYPESFYPKPKVLSSFIKLVPRSKKFKVESFEQFKYLIKRSFQSRRKKIKNNLIGLIDFEKFEEKFPDINLNLRPENISIEEYIRISDYISSVYHAFNGC